MMNAKLDWALRIGLLFVALSWFSFTFYEFTVAALQPGKEVWPIIFTDLPGTLGLGFRTAAGFVAVITILFYIGKRDLSGPEVIMSIRWILILEAAYFFVSFFPSALWVFVAPPTFDRLLLIVVESTLPCLVESIMIPMVLAKLFLELSPMKSGKGAIKWGLVSGTLYLFVFWLNNTGNWIGTIVTKGVEYVSLYPINLFSFAITTFGLFLLTLFAAYFSKMSFGEESLSKLDMKKIGIIVTAFGLYFEVIYVLWLFFGNVGGWSIWYAWFLGHNVDLWAMSVPLVGLPLLFREKA